LRRGWGEGGERGGLYLGYAKFCPNYWGEAAGRVW